MEKAFFFNSMDGDRKYKAGDIARYFGALVNDGILPNPSTNLQIVADDGMSIVVKAGFMWINSGYLYWNDSDLIIPLENADRVLNRIDRIVVRWMNTERDIRAYAVTGTPASSPTAPAIQRDTDYYEMCLGDVAVSAGTTQIIQANITDQRLSTTLCGMASATYNQIDTLAFNAQLQSWYDTFTAESQADFNAWFNALQDVLDENTEANLLTLINGLDARMTLVRSGLTLPASGWTAYTGGELQEVNYQYSLTHADVMAANMVDIYPHNDSLDETAACGLSEVNTSYDGGVIFYATNIPSQEINFDMKIVKG